MTLSLGFIVESLSADFSAVLVGDPDVQISGLAPIETASGQQLTFISHVKYVSKLAQSAAGCVIVSPALREAAARRGPCIVADDPYRYYARVTQLWKRHTLPALPPAIHASAIIHSTAQLGAGVSIAAFAVIGEGAVIEDGAVIGEHCVVESRAVVGKQTRLAPRVTLGADCSLGDRCLLHPGVVIGADGFGFARHPGGWEKIEQLGAVRIGDDVEIGANTCIDRGALQDTLIEDGVKLDNLIQIGHNVRVGKNTAMAGCVGVAGSATIGANCTLGGGAIVLGHLELADDVHISAASVVTRSLLKPGHYTGIFPIDDNAAWEKNAATAKQLHSLRGRLKHLEKQLDLGADPLEEKP
ncbi:MAG: UDP-3-O-(3-hydroxymyristoyl)glucosamine N-acyltransferase [Pseudomonadota bacterium]